MSMNILETTVKKFGSIQAVADATKIPAPTLFRWQAKGLPLSAEYVLRLIAQTAETPKA
jgi:hypothetical protein